ncbi:hypothetical protein RP726_05830 [Candidatus Methylospira mobilis]|uniref:hypothetical protein n=1 Tax=Candidatus Methylospira mobilis TaxID=1808979 RepID=UPI0028EAC59F|nr:hypothetical protein [Candidatus Methylospira mobilis]WNV05932.1 hypothetical protein RP726_05830 [Candidatus Methylospira mobilis]
MAGAAEGKVVANLFAPAGDWDVPAGFAKNGDTLRCPGRFREKWRHASQSCWVISDSQPYEDSCGESFFLGARQKAIKLAHKAGGKTGLEPTPNTEVEIGAWKVNQPVRMVY